MSKLIDLTTKQGDSILVNTAQIIKVVHLKNGNCSQITLTEKINNIHYYLDVKESLIEIERLANS